MTAYIGYFGGGGYYNIPTLRGKYDLLRQKQKQAISGAIFASGIQRVVWVFPYMSTTDFDWWVWRYNAGSPVTFRLYRDDTRRTELDFTAGYLLFPTYGGITKNAYTDVRIEITNLVPIVTT